MSDLTPRQTQILRLIQDTISSTGMPPTRAEIARELGFRSANAAEEHLRALARKGVISLVPGTSRGIQLQGHHARADGPAAHRPRRRRRPILAEENIEARLQIDPDVFQPRPHYLLKVIGMSMKDAGILDGDLVAVHRTPEVRSRQIVVARLENEVTVKRYRQEGSVVWLLPENADFEPIRVDLKEAAAAHRRRRGGRDPARQEPGSLKVPRREPAPVRAWPIQQRIPQRFPTALPVCCSTLRCGAGAALREPRRLPTGFTALDAALPGGGWPRAVSLKS